MKGLVVKDLMIIKHHVLKMRPLIVLIALIISTLTVFNDSFLVLNILMLFIAINNISHTFINEEESGLLKFLYVTTDVSFSKMTLSRYTSYSILSLMFIGLFTVLFGVFNLIYNLYTLKQFFIVITVLVCAALLYIILSTPFLYLFLQNGFVIMTITILIGVVILERFNLLNSVVIEGLINTSNITLFLYSIIATIILFFLSHWLSTNILKVKVKGDL